jgi:GNAT superfamily N-acetyltransferase
MRALRESIRLILREAEGDQSTSPSVPKERVQRVALDRQKRLSVTWSEQYTTDKGLDLIVRHYAPNRSDPFESDLGYFTAWTTDDPPIGVGEMVLNDARLPEHKGKVAFDIEVSSTYRRMGIGTVLMRAVRDKFGRQPIPSSHAYSRTRQPSEDAQKMWASWDRKDG